MRYADTSRGRPFSKDPAVVRFQRRYWMYYSLPPFGDGRPGDGWAIGIATSDDLEDWHKQGEILPEQACEQTYLFFQGNNDMGQTWYLSQIKVRWQDGQPQREKK